MPYLHKLLAILTAQDLRYFAAVFLCMLLGSALNVAGVASILPFMQLVAAPEMVQQNKLLSWLYSSVEFDSERQMLLWTGGAVFALFTLSVCMSTLNGWLIARFVWVTAHRLCMRLLRIYLQVPYEHFLNNSSAELLRRLVSDVNRLLSEILMAGCQMLARAIMALGLLTLLVLVEPVLALSAFAAFGALYAVLHLVRHRYLVRLGQQRITTDQQRFVRFTDAMTGMKAIRVAGASSFFLDRFERASGAYSTLYPRFELYHLIPRYVVETMAFGGILLVVLFMVATKRDFVAAIPVLSLFALATYRMLPALHTVFAGAARISNSLPVIDTLYRDVRWQAELQMTSDSEAPPIELTHGLALEKVSFTYQGAAAPSAQDIDIRVACKERVAIVGSTGSGKTTLVDIVVGLLTPQQGRFTVDDVPIGRDNVAGWLSSVAYVPQDVFLYDETIARNIAFGVARDSIDLERVRHAARIAQIDQFIIDTLVDGYETRVGERGVRLSGGERQRIGIARAIYRNPKLLVLDEATSALDGVTEEAVMTALEHELPHLTVIMVAHRLSTVRHCDRIYLMERGRVVRSGSFEELYQSSPSFKQMVETTT